jgi:hypothetical protein
MKQATEVSVGHTRDQYSFRGSRHVRDDGTRLLVRAIHTQLLCDCAVGLGPAKGGFLERPARREHVNGAIVRMPGHDEADQAAQNRVDVHRSRRCTTDIEKELLRQLETFAVRDVAHDGRKIGQLTILVLMREDHL